MKCQICSRPLPETGGPCPDCDTPVLDGLEDVTAPSPLEGTPPSHSSGPRPRVTHRFLPGSILNRRYRIVSLLGRGGMGEVYRADDLTLRQQVALKLLPSGLEQDPTLLRRLTDEVALARQIAHPNVCRVFDIDVHDAHPFLSMEYIDGENLGVLLRRVGRLPVDRAADVGAEICRGLAAAHAEGILHRDLKPANVMIDGRGRAKITDFGLAVLDRATNSAEPRLGTPAYMAPEQLRGEPASSRSDIYALGLVLYKVFTGQDPHTSISDRPQSGDPSSKGQGSVGRAYARLRRSPPRPLSERVPNLAPEIESTLLRCLSVDPRDRPGSVLEVAEALSASLGEGEGPVRGTSQPPGEVFFKTLVFGGGRRSSRDADLHDAADRHGGRRGRDLGPGCWLFDHPLQAVRFALEAQGDGRTPGDDSEETERLRLGIHFGELAVPEGLPGNADLRPTESSRRTAKGLVDLADEGQILLSRQAFDLARQSAEAVGPEVRWLAHGKYEIEGIPEPLPVFEVGIDGDAPLAPPSETPRARRGILQSSVTGWRPAVGLELPQRPHWIIQRQLGEGGFGEVWLARHQKTGEQRVFKFCYDSHRLRGLQREITLFRLLKEALGERSDINRIFDWNFDQSPFFIEAAYTEGGSLADWVEEQGGLAAVPLAVRLDIVAQVATALGAAHSVGVLHKDVKPQNVLVTQTEDGRIRAQLNDFGVGLLTERQRLAEAGITALGMTEDDGVTASSPTAGGTPLYAAPEVLEGKPPSLQADIYALGVTLYQMIVGDFSRALAPGWERHVDDDLLRLDIASAVDGSPERRLADARRLADRLRDLEERRRLLGVELREKQEAQQAKAALRLARRRRRIAALATAGMLIAILVAAALVVQTRRAAREAAMSRLTTEFLVDLFRSPDPFRNPGDPLTAREILDRGSDKIETSLEDQPEIQARLMEVMGTSYSSLGVHDQAEILTRKAYERRRDLLGPDHPGTLQNMNDLAKVLSEASRYGEAAELAREALARLEGQGTELPPTAAVSLSVLAEAAFVEADYEAAEAYSRRALTLRRKHSGERHPATADETRRLAATIMAQGRHGEAEPLYRNSLEVYRTIHGDEHPEIAYGLHHLALLMQGKGDLATSEEYFRESQVLFRRTLGDSHPYVASSLSHLAVVLQASGKLRESEELYREALGIHALSGPNLSTAGILTSMATLFQRQGDYEKAKAASGEALVVYRQLLGEDHHLIAMSLQTQAVSQVFLSDLEAAEALHAEALSMLRRLPEDHGLVIALSELRQGTALLKIDFPAEAEPLLRKSLAGLRNYLPAEHLQLALGLNTLGGCLSNLGKLEEAEKILLEARRYLRNAGGPGGTQGRQLNLERLAKLYASQGRIAEAAEIEGLLEKTKPD
ncbi:MAG: tetratricopeptide repeat protein [Acidobacteriota bacterium]